MGQAGRWLRGAVAGWALAIVPAWAAGAPHLGPLLPGEGLVLYAGEATPMALGEVKTVTPMGELARVLWLKLLGDDWSIQDLRYQCSGGDTPFPCGGPKGHGKVDLEGAFRKGCDRAFLAWSQYSMAQWRQEEGGSVARLQLLDTFAPFLGNRLPPGNDLPPITPPWIGRGELLQTSPADLAAWLEDPLQMELLTTLPRFCSGYFVDVKVLLGKEGWWILPATAPAPGGGTRAWVLAGRGDVLVVLRLPAGRGEVEGLARLKAILEMK